MDAAGVGTVRLTGAGDSNSAKSENPKIEAIERFFTAYAADDVEGVAQVLPADIEWTNFRLAPLPDRLAREDSAEGTSGS